MFRTITVARYIFVGCTIILSGCAVGPLYKEPVVEVPESYRLQELSDQEAMDLEWWKLFNDPVLLTLVSEALEQNRDAKIAAARIEQATAALGFTRADQYPRIDVAGSAQRGNLLNSTRSQSTDYTAFIGLPLSWEIDFWGKLRRATEAARAELLASEYGLKTVQISLISSVVSTYYLLLDFHQRLAISKATLETRLKSLEIIQQRFDKGIIPELDVNQAQIQKEIAAAAIPLYEREIAKTENALSILVGKLPSQIETGNDLNSQRIPPQIPSGLPADLLNRRPDILQAKFLLKAQTENIGVAQALRLPAISLTGALGIASTDIGSVRTEGGFWSIGGTLLGPIFNFGKNVRRVEIIKAQTKQALFFYERSVLNAFREVEDALVEIETYARQLQSLKLQRDAAANANMLSKQRYDKGVSSYLEVLETERQLFNVKLELSQLTQLYLSAHATLYKALGGGWVSKSAMVNNEQTGPST